MGPNLGSFGAATGGLTPELQAAIQSRSGGGSPMSQVTNTAPTADPSTQAAQPPTASSPGVPSASTGAPNLPFDSSEAKMILGAMSTRLKAISKLSGV